MGHLTYKKTHIVILQFSLWLFSSRGCAIIRAWFAGGFRKGVWRCAKLLKVVALVICHFGILTISFLSCSYVWAYQFRSFDASFFLKKRKKYLWQIKNDDGEFLVWNNFTSFQTDPVEYVENMCENMQLYPLQDFLTGDQLLFEYKPEVRRFPFLTLNI